MTRLLAAFLLLASAGTAIANDSTAELGAGGLILARTDAVAMEKEVLSISPELVSVDYVFRNTTDKDVTTVVAFPMPEILGNPYYFPAVPKDPDDNFLGFSVTIDGESVTPQLEQKAFAMGVDVTKELQERGVPLYPNGEKVYAALAKLPADVADDWINPRHHHSRRVRRRAGDEAGDVALLGAAFDLLVARDLPGEQDGGRVAPPTRGASAAARG